jgi:hypothetical protein
MEGIEVDIHIEKARSAKRRPSKSRKIALFDWKHLYYFLIIFFN